MEKSAHDTNYEKVLKLTAVIMKLDEIEVHGKKNVSALLACMNALEELKDDIRDETKEE